MAAGGAGDESPLYFNDKSLAVQAKRQFRFNTGGRAVRGRAPGPAKLYLNVAPVNAGPNSKPLIIWRNATIAIRQPLPQRKPGETPPVATGNNIRNFPPAGPKLPLRSVISAETAKRLNFGNSPDGTPIGPDDFASGSSVNFEVIVPEGSFGVELLVDAEVGPDRDQVYRVTFSDREDGGSRGIPTRALLGDPSSEGYKKFKTGVLELAQILPPNTHSEPTPADKDPVPDPFDSTFNVPEHDEFVLKVKYIRDDRFIYENMLDASTRKRLDQAWNDLYASFDYHDNYLRMIAQHFKLDLKGKHIGDMTRAQIETLPAEVRKYVSPLASKYQESLSAQAAARPAHIEDCMQIASR